LYYLVVQINWTNLQQQKQKEQRNEPSK